MKTGNFMTSKYSKMWDKWAKVWDSMLSFWGYDTAYREQAVEKLGLKKGDVVLDLACGTGLNFEYLERKVGKEGKIIALDYSHEMLKKAREKIEENGWNNIKLLERDVSNFKLNEKVDAVLCTWAMVSIPNYKKALENSIETLRNGGKHVVLDIQQACYLIKLFFKATHQDITRKPWKEMRKYLNDVKKEDLPSLLASYYIASGVKR